MDDRGPPNFRDRRPSGRPGDRPARRGYFFPRAEHRHPVYGSQAHRDNRQAPYIIGFIIVVGALAAFLYLGLNWATGPGRATALANPPTPTPIAVVPPAPPPPRPTGGQQSYIVQARANPAAIAAPFQI